MRTPSIRFLLFVALFLPFALRAEVVRSFQSVPIPLAAENANLFGVHYLSQSGKAGSGEPILLTHGLNSNLHEFASLVPMLLEAGYDCYAFNFRGHGNDEERSRVRNYHAGDYGFEKMVDVDLPAMIRYVRTQTGQPIFIIGHSMGGMIPRAALIRGKIAEADVRSMVLLGSPPHFANLSLPSDRLGLDRLVESYANAGSGDDGMDLISLVNTLNQVGQWLPFYKWMQWTFRPLGNYLFRGIGVLDNFGEQEDWMEHAITRSPPKDIYRDLLNFKKRGYPYRDVSLGVPVLHIAGELDKLAVARDVMEGGVVQSQDSGFWGLILEGVSHLDLVAATSVQAYKESLLTFLASSADAIRADSGTVRRLKPAPCAKHLVKKD